MLGRVVLRTMISLLLALAGGSCGSDSESQPLPSRTEDNKLAASALSHSGRYRITVRPTQMPPSLAALHQWTVRIEPANNTVAKPTRILFDASMPSHGHGLVTTPQVTRNLGDGEFLVEGVKFHMAGDWEIRVTVIDAQSQDQALIQVTVPP